MNEQHPQARPVTMLKKPLRVNDLQETLRHLAHKSRAEKRQRIAVRRSVSL